MRLGAFALAIGAVLGSATACRTTPPAAAPEGGGETAILAGGCFWCAEAAFDGLPGVIEAVSGYTGGERPNPTYDEVSAGGTGHLESIRVRFDPSKITYAQILDVFWRQIDPTDAGGQFADRGSQYRTAIFVQGDAQRRIAEASKRELEATHWFDKPIATMILPAGPFYPAEEYHQNYHVKHPIAYAMYRWGSGRGSFLARAWKGKPPIAVTDLPAATPGAAYVKPTDDELRRLLTPLQYEVTQHGATETAFANPYWDHHEPGLYVDVVSGEPLFSSTDKFDSGTGWPSFSKSLEPDHVVSSRGSLLDAFGVEVHSRLAASHLGHLFYDGPPPTRLRYCIDSASLKFVPAGELKAHGLDAYTNLFEP